MADQDQRQDNDRLLAALTPREREVLACLAKGAGRQEVAEQLHLSANTVRTHLQNLMAKLGVHSTLEAVAMSRPHLEQLRPAAADEPGGLRRRDTTDEGVPPGRRPASIDRRHGSSSALPVAGLSARTGTGTRSPIRPSPGERLGGVEHVAYRIRGSGRQPAGRRGHRGSHRLAAAGASIVMAASGLALAAPAAVAATSTAGLADLRQQHVQPVHARLPAGPAAARGARHLLRQQRHRGRRLGAVLSWAQLGTLAAAGNEIGGKTVDGTSLTTLTTAQQISEICNDRQNHPRARAEAVQLRLPGRGVQRHHRGGGAELRLRQRPDRGQPVPDRAHLRGDAAAQDLAGAARLRPHRAGHAWPTWRPW